MSLLLNICKYNNCGLVFPNLNQLIQHIEEEHINFEAGYVEKLEMARPAALPLSYVLPSNIELLENCDSDEEYERHSTALTDSELQTSGAVPMSDEISNVSESADANFEDEVNPDDSFTFDFIMRYGSKRSADQDEKPFICPMPDCTKRYKNVNGLRYHARNGHKRNIKPPKKYECYCGRGYKTAQGLRAHAMALHNIALILPNSSSMPQTEDPTSLLTLANMPNNAFEHIHQVNRESDTYRLKNRISVVGDAAAELDLTAALTDATCSRTAFGFAPASLEPKFTFKCATAGMDQDENSSSSCNSSVWQDITDFDEKNTQTKVADDDEIDVGDAKDAVYPYH